MKLSEKLYNLRRKQGLSQEAVAEKLDCSRQVISKWENGTSTPDVEMLRKYSELFDVSIDYLVKEDIIDPTSASTSEKDRKSNKLLEISGAAIALFGCVALAVLGVLSLFGSGTADKIAGSSAVQIDGMFIAMLVSVSFVLAGVLILVKAIKHK